MAKMPRTVYVCTNCGEQTAKWFGRCPACNQWNTMQEEDYTPPVAPEKEKKVNAVERYQSKSTEKTSVLRLSDINLNDEIRFKTGLKEFDRVLGGGLVKGSVALLSGEPGIGKSTLLLQICD